MKNLLVSFICLTSFFLNSQTWGPATPFPGASGVFDPNSNGVHTKINSLCEYSNELYVGGNFTSIGGIVAHCIARWNGTNWNSLGAGNFLQNTILSDIIVYNGSLYFTADKLYKWDGSTIQEFTYFDTNSQTNKSVLGTDLHVYNNELYIVSDIVGGAGGIMKYNGTNFTVIQENNFGFKINCLDVLNNSIYVGTSEGLFKYEAGNWIDCNGITTSTPIVYDIEPYNNEIYVLGYFNSIGGLTVNNFAKNNGSSWSNVILPGNNYPYTYPIGSNWNLGTNHLKVMNNELYFAHTFYPNFNLSPLVKFNGNQWTQLALNHTNGGGCSIIYNNELFCGGNFNTIDGITMVDHLAKLQGSASTEDKQNLQIQISPNPTKDIISIKVGNIKDQSFYIFDQMGRELFKGKLTGTETEVNLSALSKGMYTLKIEGNYQPAQIVKE